MPCCHKVSTVCHFDLVPPGQGLLALYLPGEQPISARKCTDLVLFSCHLSQGTGRPWGWSWHWCHMPTPGRKVVASPAALMGVHISLWKGSFVPCFWERTLAWFVLNIFLFVSSTGSEYPLKHREQVNKPSCLVLFTLYWHLRWPKEQKKITGHIWGLIKHCSRESFLSHYKHLLEVHLLI